MLLPHYWVSAKVGRAFAKLRRSPPGAYVKAVDQVLGGESPQVEDLVLAGRLTAMVWSGLTFLCIPVIIFGAILSRPLKTGTLPEQIVKNLLLSSLSICLAVSVVVNVRLRVAERDQDQGQQTPTPRSIPKQRDALIVCASAAAILLFGNLAANAG